MNTNWMRGAAITAALGIALTACNSGGSSESRESGSTGLDDLTTEEYEVAEDTAPAIAEVGSPAPNFALRDLSGERHKLSDHRGKVVVLEWYNPQCPFVVYAHEDGGPLNEASQRWRDEGVVWMAINSGAPGKQGAGAELNREMKEQFGITYPLLIDESGDVGRKYQAKTTPHMYVIDEEGTLVYAGGLDNAPFGKVGNGGEIQPYVDQVLTDVLAGKEPRVRSSKPYGCSVKYAK